MRIPGKSLFYATSMTIAGYALPVYWLKVTMAAPQRVRATRNTPARVRGDVGHSSSFRVGIVRSRSFAKRQFPQRVAPGTISSSCFAVGWPTPRKPAWLS
jgi:hypothetical protein